MLLEVGLLVLSAVMSRILAALVTIVLVFFGDTDLGLRNLDVSMKELMFWWAMAL